MLSSLINSEAGIEGLRTAGCWASRGGGCRCCYWLVLAIALLWAAPAQGVVLFSYDASGGQLPTDQGWQAFEVDTTGPLTAASLGGAVTGTTAANANAAIEMVSGMNVLHIRDTLTDSTADLPNFYYPWTTGQQQTLLNNGLKFTMVFQPLTNSSNNGNMRFGFNGTEFEIQAANIGADQAISVTNFGSATFPVDGAFHTLEITGQRDGANFNFSYRADGGAATALGIVSNPSPAAIESTVYFGALSSAGRNTDLLVKSVVMETLGVVAPQVASITRVNGTSYGSLTLTNNDSPITIAAYSVLSNGGALSPANWTSIADNYDFSGNKSVDPNDEWIKLSSSSVRNELTEFEPDGDAAILGTGQSISLGNVWIQNPTEDVTVELLLTDGTILPVTVQYSGNAGNRFAFGDLDFDGDFDVSDFTGKFVPSFGTNTSFLSSAEKYQKGDFNGDNNVDEIDFLIYNKAYLAAHPGAASLSLSAVPEPTTLALLTGACIGVAVVRRRRSSLGLFTALFALVVILSVSATESSAATAIAHWNFDEAPAATFLNDVVGTNDSTSIGTAVPGAVGKVGGAWTFGGGNDAVTIDPSSGNLTGLGINYSFSSWVKSTDNLGVLLSMSDNTEGSEEVAFRISDNGDPDGRIGVLGRPNIDGPGGEALSTSLVNDNVWHHVAYTSSASGWKMYVDGVLENSGAVSSSPASIGANVVHIGANEDSSGLQFGLNGLIDELSVWNAPLTDAEIKNLYVKGVFGHGALEAFNDTLSLEVNRTTGSTQLKNASGTAFDIDLYRIVGGPNSLQAANWDSLDLQNVDSSAWTELANSNTKVSEGTFGGSSVLGSGFAQSLGNLYNTATDAQNLVLEYHVAGTPTALLLTGSVNYVTGAGLTGDYNGDGTVNAADYTVWRDTFGRMGAGLAADGNGDNKVDSNDYTVWKNNFGMSLGSGGGALSGAASVPEPASLGLAICAVAAVLGLRKRSGLQRALGCLAALLLTASLASANVTNERNYQLGDDGDENGSVGTTVGSSTGGVTYDSAGTLGTGDLQDLNVNGNPVYVNASSRPGALGTNRGASFDGVDDSLRTAKSFNSPSEYWDDTTIFPLNNFPHNYDTIYGHGIQLWAKPSAGGLGHGNLQGVVFDTLEQGIYITANDTWGLWYDVAAGPGIDSGVAVDTVSNGGWTHLMQLGGADDPVNGKSRLVGGLLVNGVAVATLASVYDVANTQPLVLGGMPVEADPNATTNYYTGVLDDVRLFLWGDNTGQNSGDGRLGQNWGSLDLAVDNDWIKQKLSSLGVSDRADVNLDGMVSGNGTGPAATDDLTAFIQHWKYRRLVGDVQVGDWISRQNGDLNYDGIVDLRDAFILRSGLVAAGAGAFDLRLLSGGGVPEPTSALVMLSGMLALAGGPRRRGRSPRA